LTEFTGAQNGKNEPEKKEDETSLKNVGNVDKLEPVY